MAIVKQLGRYRKAYRNYLSVMWGLHQGKKEIKVILKNGNSYKLTASGATSYTNYISNKNINIVPDTLNDALNIKFSYKDKNITLPLNEGDIPAVFINEEYKFLNVDNENVIDIGANIGDSPIYFALNNAKRVIALEPYPYSYNIALKNIKTNKFEDNIILLNAGYGKDGVIYIDSDFKNTTGSDLKNVQNGKEIKTISLKTLLNVYNIESAVLKMDCEGCEYNILNENNNTLRCFKRIQLEYHYGYEKIKNRLEEAGFTVKYTEPKKNFNKYASNHNMELGYIFGVRN